MSTKILLIEDNPDHVLITRKVLEKAPEKYELDAASNAREGLDMLSNTDYDIVISDYNLPDLTAIDILREIHNRGKGMPFIAVTALGNEKMAVDLMKEGAYDYILKDFSYEETLPVVIRRSLERFYAEREKKRLEQQIRKERDTAQRYLDVAGVMIVVLNGKGEVQLINRIGCELLGYSQEEMIGKNWFENFIPCSIREKVEEAFHGLFGDNPALFKCFQSNVLTKTKEERMIVWNNVPLNDEDGKVSGVLCAGADFTERRRMQEKLRASTVLFRTLAQVAPVGIFRTDAKGNCTYTNERWIEITGAPIEQSLGQLWLEAIYPEDRRRVIDEWSRCVQENKPFELEYRFQRNQEAPTWVLGQAMPEISDTGKVVGFVGTITDITEHKKTEAALRESEEKYRNVIENIAIGVSVISPRMEIFSMNRQMKEWFPHADLTRENTCYKVYNNPPRGEVCEYCPTNKTLQDGQIHEAITETPSGDKIINFRVVSTPLKDNEGKITAAVEMVDNITERIQTAEIIKQKEELQEAYNQLKHTEAQLVQSEKMAAVGQLASGVAHEINNPLTGILNNVQLIKMEMQQKNDARISEFKDILDLMEESAMRCKKITRSLLDFSRVSKGIFQPFSLNEAVEKVIALIEYEMRVDNIAMNKELQPDCPQVRGDIQVIQQVILNLISNSKWAIQKKSKKEGGEIRIGTFYEPQMQKVTLYIKDTGIGISREYRTKIFEPFFTTKPVGEGTGLGLSIVYKIIKDHKGTIEVESEVDKGATFKISFPPLRNESASIRDGEKCLTA